MFDNTNRYNEFEGSNPGLFGRISEDILSKGYSINPAALPLDLSDSLLKHIKNSMRKSSKKPVLGVTNF